MPTSLDQPGNVVLVDSGSAGSQAPIAGFSSLTATWDQAPGVSFNQFQVSVFSAPSNAPPQTLSSQLVQGNSFTTNVPQGGDYVVDVRQMLPDGTPGGSSESNLVSVPAADQVAPAPQINPSGGGNIIPGPPNDTGNVGGVGGGSGSNQIGPPAMQEGQYVVLSLDGTQVILPLSEDWEEVKPTRSSTVNTLGGAYQEAWGAGIGTVTLAGNTGWHAMGPNGNGVAFIKRLFEMKQAYDTKTATEDPANVRFMAILPPTDGGGGHVYRVSPDELRVMRNKQSPLLFRYRWSFTVLEDQSYPTPSPTNRFDVNGGIRGEGGNAPGDGSSGGAPSPTSGLVGAAANAIEAAAGAINPLRTPLRATLRAPRVSRIGSPATPAPMTAEQAAAMLGTTHEEAAAAWRRAGLSPSGVLPPGVYVFVPPSRSLIPPPRSAARARGDTNA